jgi:hypothetical protein
VYAESKNFVGSKLMDAISRLGVSLGVRVTIRVRVRVKVRVRVRV